MVSGRARGRLQRSRLPDGRAGRPRPHGPGRASPGRPGLPFPQAPRRNRVAGRQGLEKVLPLPRQRLSADVRTVRRAPGNSGLGRPSLPLGPHLTRLWLGASGGSAAGRSPLPRLGVRAGRSLGGRPEPLPGEGRGGEACGLDGLGGDRLLPPERGRWCLPSSAASVAGRWPLACLGTGLPLPRSVAPSGRRAPGRRRTTTPRSSSRGY